MNKSDSFALAKEAADVWVSSGFLKREAAQKLKIPETTFKSRLIAAQRFGIIENTDAKDLIAKHVSTHQPKQHITIKDGIIIIGSDAHYWPKKISPAHKAFVKVIKELQPKSVILNGDVLDGCTISRFPPIGWEDRPTLSQEVEECQERLQEIYDACPNARHIWTAGNHDLRFETRLATVAPEFARIKGIHLKDHFPEWDTAWSAWINNDIVVKHRYKGGIHATHNNTLWSGKTMVTGHLHSLKVTPLTDYDSTRWGVDSGTLSPKDGPMFEDYTETSPVNWVQGFVVLTIYHGKLLWPELVHVMNNHEYEFRGRVYRI